MVKQRFRHMRCMRMSVSGVAGGHRVSLQRFLDAPAVGTSRLNACIVAHSSADIRPIWTDVTISSVLWPWSSQAPMIRIASSFWNIPVGGPGPALSADDPDNSPDCTATAAASPQPATERLAPLAFRKQVVRGCKQVVDESMR